MSILELHGFNGMAQVLGAVRRVSVEPDAIRADARQLVIGGLGSVDEANAILNALAIGLKSVTLPASPRSEAAPAPAPQPPRAPAPSESTTKTGRSSAAQPAASNPPRDPVKTDDLPGDLGQDGKGAPDNVVDINAAKAAASTGGAIEVAGAKLDIARYAALGRLRDVLNLLKEQGVTEVSAIVAACVALKPHVTFLGRVADSEMERRVNGAIAAAAKEAAK